MILVVTSIELKSPIRFFALSYNALKILKQLKSTRCAAYKSRGFWTRHYTMSLWENHEDMKSFARSGAHLEAMKQSAALAKEIRTVVLEVPAPLSWKAAKEQLAARGRTIVFPA